ncbi:MAG: hypothetical protein KF708_00895 [Pirellulales bacterium]|nr:hypothetical protein [Pirellulales bacterium]
MTRSYTIVRRSNLAAPAERVWAHAITMRGVNDELWPLVRMSFPREAATLTLSGDKLGRPLFRSWIYLFGVLPIDYDEITLVEFEPGERFLERSPMLTQAVWQHERTVESCPGGCTITDHVEYRPRVAWLGPLYPLPFGLAFAWRHWRLRRMFGELP